MVEQDPLFLPDDMEAVREWQREQSLICSGCGHPRDETMDKRNQHAYKTSAYRCFACESKEKAARRAAEKGGAEGLYFAAELMEDSDS
jgi:hypothetical protein